MNKSLIRKNTPKLIPKYKRGKIIEKFSIGSFTGKAMDIFNSWINEAKKAFEQIINAAQDEAAKLTAEAEKITRDAYELSKNSVVNVANEAIEFGENTYDQAREFGEEALDTIEDGAMDAINQTGEFATEVVHDAYDAAEYVVEKTEGAIDDSMDFFDELGGHLGDFFGFFEDLWKDIEEIFKVKNNSSGKKYDKDGPNTNPETVGDINMSLYGLDDFSSEKHQKGFEDRNKEYDVKWDGSTCEGGMEDCSVSY